jgi:2-polyprenyl-3-methyl-5-hydroxy-6-metoxy-1,4-benzoquinol methylase
VSERFCIKSGYRHRESSIYFDDRNFKDEWQKEVYLRVLSIMEERQLTEVADVGCGSGYKLVNYLGMFTTMGYDVAPTVEYLQGKYPDRTWHIADFRQRGIARVPMVVCADVIEHVENPDELMDFLLELSSKWVVLSTPERDLVYPKASTYLNGPPQNLTHLREWNFREFRNYISGFITVTEHCISNIEQATQMIVGKIK